MTRSHGRCARGERLRMGFPHGHRKTTTLVAGLRMTGMIAPMVLDCPINGDWFEAYVTNADSGLNSPGIPRLTRPGFRELFAHLFRDYLAVGNIGDSWCFEE